MGNTDYKYRKYRKGSTLAELLIVFSVLVTFTVIIVPLLSGRI